MNQLADQLVAFSQRSEAFFTAAATSNQDAIGRFFKYFTDNPLLIAAVIGGIVTITVARTTLHGVKISLKAASDRSLEERSHAAQQAEQDRELTKDQAAQERKHSADEAHRDRITAMRREVYLEAVTEMLKAQATLANLVKQDFSKLDPSTILNGLLTSTARITVVSEQATALRVRALVPVYGKVMLGLIHLIAPLEGLRSRIAMNDDRYAATQSEIAKILESMKSFVEAKRVDPPVFAGMEHDFNQQQQWAKDCVATGQELRNQIIAIEAHCAEFVRSSFMPIAFELDEIACAIRIELGLHTEVDVFKQQTIDAHAKLNEALADFRKKLGATPLLVPEPN